MKRIVSLLLVLIMFFCMSIYAFAGETKNVTLVMPNSEKYIYSYSSFNENFDYNRKFIPVVREFQHVDNTPKKLIPIVKEQKNEVQTINCELIPVVPKQKEQVKIGEYNLIPIVPEQKKQVQINENIFIPVVSYTKPIEPSNTVKIIPIIPVTGVLGEMQ